MTVGIAILPNDPLILDRLDERQQSCSFHAHHLIQTETALALALVLDLLTAESSNVLFEDYVVPPLGFVVVVLRGSLVSPGPMLLPECRPSLSATSA